MKTLNYTFGFIFFVLFFNSNESKILAKNLENPLKVKSVKPYSLPSSLSGLDYVYGDGPSDFQTITIVTTDLTTRPFLTISAPAGFEVSLEIDSNYANSFTMDAIEITTADIILYVRLAGNLPVNTYTGDLTLMAPSIVPFPVFNETIQLEGTVSTALTVWNGSAWSLGIPDENYSVILDGNYNTNSSGSINAYDLKVNTNMVLTVDNGTFTKTQQDVDVDGQVIIETEGALVQVSDTANFIVNEGGSAQVNKTTSPLAHWYDYTYWSSPVSNITALNAFAEASSSRRYWYDAQNFLDILSEIDNTNTFEAGHDDIDDNGDDWAFLSDETILSPGVGYATAQNSGGFAVGNTYNFSFEGTFNTGIITTPLYYNGDNGDKDWNLIGNPYPSAISADAFFAENTGKVGEAIYLWSHASTADADGSGNSIYNFTTDDYAIINSGSGEVAGGKNIIPNRYIPSGQGFFIQALANDNVVYNNSMRQADATSNDQFFRNQETFNKLWINLTSDNGIFNQLLVAYVDDATDGNDGLAYDTQRNLSSDVAAIIYTTISDDLSAKYAIQGKASSSINANESIPLGFYTSINDATIYTFSIGKIQGEFLTESPVYLVDNIMNITHDLKQSDYNFTSTTGEFNERFTITFDVNTLQTNNFNPNSQNVTVIYNQPNTITFKTNSNKTIKAISIFDMNGKVIKKVFGTNNTKSIKTNGFSKGAYVAAITLNSNVVVTKKIII